MQVITPERLTEIKKICACLPFADNDAGIPETQEAIRELINSLPTSSSPSAESAVVEAARKYHEPATCRVAGCKLCSALAAYDDALGGRGT